MKLKRLEKEEMLETIREILLFSDWKASPSERYVLAKTMKIPQLKEQQKIRIDLVNNISDIETIKLNLLLYGELKSWLLKRQIYIPDVHYDIVSRIHEMVDFCGYVLEHDLYGAVFVFQNPSEEEAEHEIIKFDSKTAEKLKFPNKPQAEWWT